VIDCIQMNGGTEMVCNAVKDNYGDHPSGLIVTGDNSGYYANSTAGIKDGLANTDFQVIKDVLAISTFDIKRPSKVNPRFVVSRKIINYAFKHLDISIDERAAAVINDLNNARSLPNGKLLKDRESNKQDAGDSF